MKTAVIFLAISSATSTFAASYTSSFPLTENPISEQGNWSTGRSVGLDWNDVRTTPGLAFGTQIGNETGNAQYSDSTAILTGSWGPIQTVTVVAKVISAPNAGQAEVEIRLRSAISNHLCTGYEIDVSVDSVQQYFAIDRWNGALGSFTLLNVNYGAPQVRNGDVIKATIDANGLIIAYLNNVEMVRATDTTFATGNPGIGFYVSGATGLGANFGLSSFTATDGVSDAPAAPSNLRIMQ